MRITQAQEILDLIRRNNNEGVTNYDLSQISLKYSSRISELRQKGYDIYPERVKRHGKASGTWLYFIREKETVKLKPIPPENARLFDAPKAKRVINF